MRSARAAASSAACSRPLRSALNAVAAERLEPRLARRRGSPRARSASPGPRPDARPEVRGRSALLGVGQAELLGDARRGDRRRGRLAVPVSGPPWPWACASIASTSWPRCAGRRAGRGASARCRGRRCARRRPRSRARSSSARAPARSIDACSTCCARTVRTCASAWRTGTSAVLAASATSCSIARALRRRQRVELERRADEAHRGGP